MDEERKQIGKWRQRIGFASSDFASCMVWQVISLYIVYFYTNIMGLNSKACATMFLITKLVDAASAVVVGCLIDKTDTRLGKSRPWILGGCIPLGIAFVAAFHVPSFSALGRLIYAYITYTLLSVTYTICNLPLSSLLSSLTDDPEERTTLATMRLIGCTTASTIVSAFTLSLVKHFGNGNEAFGFQMTAVLFAIVSVLVFLFCVANTRETVTVVKNEQENKNVLQTILGLLKWKPFYATGLMQFLVFTSYHVCMAALTYYFVYVVGSKFLAAAAATLVTLIQMAGNLAAPALTKHMTKKKGFLICSAINTVSLLIMWCAGKNHGILLAGICIYGISHGMRYTLFYAIPPDAIDYCSLVLKQDVSGTFSALCGFLIKLAGAISTSLVSVLLAIGAYNANQIIQPDSALFAIMIAFIGIPFVLNILSCVVMCLYHVDNIYEEVRELLTIQKKTDTKTTKAKKKTAIYMPADGEAFLEKEIKDEVLASGAVGYGIGIIPHTGNITAPVSGIVKEVSEMEHAVLITSENGFHVLVHVGINTAKLKGNGFEAKVQCGQKITKGELIIKADLKKIKENGYDTTTAVLISGVEKDEIHYLADHQTYQSGDKILEVGKE